MNDEHWTIHKLLFFKWRLDGKECAIKRKERTNNQNRINCEYAIYNFFYTNIYIIIFNS